MSALTPSPHIRSAARWKGLRVGILGGSFDPAHAGHMHIAKQALIRFKLHAVWWVVSPGNVLKTKNVTGDLDRRVAAVQKFISNQPKMVATDIEGHLKTRYTYDTIKALKVRFPLTQFIWIAGMDNAVDFHKWERWADLPLLMPFVFFDRPPALSKVRGKVIRQTKRIKQDTQTMTHRGKLPENGVFWMVRGRSVNLSSTSIRAKNKGKS
jgi:nicotinate-nucleotide adenylyltransferase